jgi:hypothetical protein
MPDPCPHAVPTSTGFATGLAIINTALFNYFLFDGTAAFHQSRILGSVHPQSTSNLPPSLGILTTLFGMGVCVVIISLFNYNEPEAVRPPDREVLKDSDRNDEIDLEKTKLLEA